MNLKQRSWRGFLAFLILPASLAQAGTLAGGQWQSASCGQMPNYAPFPALDSLPAYNMAVEQLNNQRQAAKTYLDCLSREANADNDAINRNVKQAYSATTAADSRAVSQLQAAEKRFNP
ncbi:MAG: hypothetical protein ACRCTU_18790 [Zoogloea sp.]|uniref:hypothetical protein n=1 Tax=Zoogloea sp. TaxID=49181 RepID=UPI003F349EDD